ncbi:hypothetical protein [Gimesia sp.]|uniref:hypothetical protein n=1 Tax=Gimesia sp. TaxID=2024833 RepID=UPI0025BE6426|nr:hypothetical protein [Gimesia sp.]
METNESNGMTHEDAVAELNVLIARAKQGDAEVIPRLCEYLDNNPILWTGPGNLALQAQAAWITLIAGQDKHLKQCLARKVNDMKQELSGTSPSPMEKLLVERVVTTWLRVHYCEAHDAQQDEESLKWAEYRLKRYRTMADLHVKSIGALTMLRKLMPVTETPRAEPPEEKGVQIDEKVEPGGPYAVEPAFHAERQHPANGHRIIGRNRLAELLGVGGGVSVGGSQRKVNGYESH